MIIQGDKEMFIYNAVVQSIYDGDTIRVDIDLGFGTWIKNVSLRLHGIDAFEIRGEEREMGLKAKEFLIEKIPPFSEVVIHTYKDRKEKYGRYLAIVYDKNGMNINQQLIVEGYAVPYLQ